MARPKSKGAYAPLAALYYLDDAILEAGPDAELLWCRILSFLASVPQANGFITDRQIRTVGINLRSVTKRISLLQEVGLLTAEPGGFSARSWLKWNRSSEEIGKTLAKDRERKANKHAEVGANSAPIPVTFRTDSDPQSSTEQSSTEQYTTTDVVVTAQKRGTRIPQPFVVTAEMRQWAAKRVPGVNVDASTEKFVNYWRAKTRDATKHDWRATWDNWLISDFERGPQSKPTRTEENLSVVQQYAQREQAGIEA